VSHAQPLAPVDSTGQTPDQPAVRQQTMFPAMGNSPIVRMSSRQTSATAEGIVQNGRLVRMMTPLYPPAAVEAHISGVVTIEARIGKDGRIVESNVVSGPWRCGELPSTPSNGGGMNRPFSMERP